jgi:hypothetical protein
MLCRFVYLLVRRFLDVLSGRFRSRLAKEVEIAVLRHQIEVLRRVGCQNSAAPLTSGSTPSRPRPSRVFELRGESHSLHQPQYALPESRQCPLWGRQPPGEFPGQQRDRIFAPHRHRGTESNDWVLEQAGSRRAS